ITAPVLIGFICACISAIEIFTRFVYRALCTKASGRDFVNLGVTHFMSTPNSQDAARKKNDAAEHGHSTEAENLNRRRRNDTNSLGVTKHLKHVPIHQLISAQITRGGWHHGT